MVCFVRRRRKNRCYRRTYGLSCLVLLSIYFTGIVDWNILGIITNFIQGPCFSGSNNSNIESLYSAKKPLFSSQPAPIITDKPVFKNTIPFKTRIDTIAHKFKLKEVQCDVIFDNVTYKIKRAVRIAKDIANNKLLELSNSYYINLSQNCTNFIETRGYITSPLTKQEEDFPIAYSILAFKDIEMVERLLRAIYRPQNYYCVHIDLKADNEFVRSMESIAKCLQHVFLTQPRIDVKWGTMSVLEPELVCMAALWGYKKWKYFINLTGQEFPLKTNYELVKILTVYNGSNDVDGTVKGFRPRKQICWTNIILPAGIRSVKGSVHVVLNRQYVDYILHNDTAAQLLTWARSLDVPDEVFFSTLNHNPQLGIPGSYKGEPETTFEGTRKPFLARYKNWLSHPKPCAGDWVREICILSTGDLPLLKNRRELFANKFHLNNDRIVIGCLEELHFNRTRDEYLGKRTFDTSYYENLGFVKDHVRV